MLRRKITSLALAFAVAVSSLGGITAFAAGTSVGGFKPDTVIEAELGSIRSNTAIASNEYSSGGRYIVSNTADISDAANIGIDEVSYIIDVEKEQNYRLFARAYFPKGTSTQFYYRWNRGEWKTFAGKANADYEWVELGEVVLKKGAQKIELCHKQRGVELDCFYLSSAAEGTPEVPAGVKARPVDSGKKRFESEQTKPFNVTGAGSVFEAEDASIGSYAAVRNDKTRSGGGCVLITSEAETRDVPDRTEDGAIELEFSTDQSRSYSVWAYILAPTSAADSGFFQIDDGTGESKYINTNIPISSEYGWFRIGNVKCTAGEKVKVKIRPRESGWAVDQFVVAAKSSYTPHGIVKEVTDDTAAALVPVTDLPPYNPPAGEHPRVYFRKSDIPTLLEKIEAEENKTVKETWLDYVSRDIVVEGTAYSSSVLSYAEAKAFYYQMYGDKKRGREAVEAILKTADWEIGDGQDITRVYGTAIEGLSIVYDWCYDLTTAAERQKMIEIAIGWASFMEIGWPPNLQGSLVGHGAETQFLRDDLSFAIATYDERPDIWNYIGGKFYAQYAPERQWHLKSQLNHQGANYGGYRNSSSGYGYLLITGMGLPEPYSGYLVGTDSYSHRIYLRRPDGMPFMDGDLFNYDPMEYIDEGGGDLIVELACSKDPLIKDELMRAMRMTDKAGNVKTSLGVTPDKWIIFSQPNVERASRAGMPLSYYFNSPMGVMAARTGWGDSLNSPTVVAEMKVGEYWFGNHQHKDSGSFQLYYKGPLATESGFYQNGVFYGSADHYNYTMQSIAHNTMLVYDPNEDKTDFMGMANDGGQRWPHGIQQTTYENILTDPQHHRANVEAHEIDPKNRMTPEYTYLKGDLTNAYSDKISDYKRSFMFLNLENDTVPAALIVFDKLTVSNPSFEKTWLLHGQQNPQINGTRTIWKSNPYVNKDTGERYTGKMVHDALLPTSDRVSLKVASGPEIGWNNIRGTNYAHPQTAADREENTYRLEISPTDSKDTNYFLNVMQVTDETNSSYLTPKLVETDKMYGVKISDRVVMFSKSGNKISGKTAITTDGGKAKYTVCDMEAGTYKITSGGAEQTAAVSEEGGVLSFEAEGGTVEIEKISGDAAENQENLKPESVQTSFIKLDGRPIGFGTEPELVNEKLMVPADELGVKLRAKHTSGFLKETYTDSEQEIEVVLRPESNIITVNGKEIPMTNGTYYKDGKLMVELRPFAEAFNYVVAWDELCSSVYMIADRKVVVKAAPGYAKTVGAKNDGGTIDSANQSPNVLDSDLSTLWAAQGKGRYFDIELEKETILENVEIIFNPNSKRTPYFEIHISDDGVNFTKIYDGAGSPEADGVNWEVFKFNPRELYKAKFVRFVSNGSDMSLWAGVKEMRFKEGAEMTVWKMTADYAKVILAKADDGDTVEGCTADNLIDSNSRTIWKTLGSGRYVDLELEDETEISGLDIVFEPFTDRSAKFAVSVSDDGENFTKIYEGKGSADAEKDSWESFDFGKKVKAKYVRYTGLGSNVSLWNGVNEIRVRK